MIIPIFAVLLSLTYRLLLERGMLLHFITEQYNYKIDLQNALLPDDRQFAYYKLFQWVMKPLLTCVACYTSWTIAISTLVFRDYCADFYFWILLSAVLVPIANTVLWAFINKMIVENNKLYSTITHIKPTFSNLNA